MAKDTCQCTGCMMTHLMRLISLVFHCSYCSSSSFSSSVSISPISLGPCMAHLHQLSRFQATEDNRKAPKLRRWVRHLKSCAEGAHSIYWHAGG